MCNEKIYSKKRGLIEVLAVVLTMLILGVASRLFAIQFPGIPYRVMGAIFCILTFAILLIKVLIIDKSTLKSIGFIFTSFAKKCLIGILVTAAFILIYALLLYILGIGFEEVLRGEVSIGTAILQTIYYIFFVAVSEEALFRGFVFHRLNQAFRSKLFIIVVTSIAFSVSHLANLQIGQLIETFVVSILYCSILYRFKDRSIVPLIVAHGLFDSFPIWLGILFYY